VEIDRAIDTIFEIGGQDSKYISITNANPLDFDMNKVCAAGTGSFLHELANKHGINIVGEFQKIALSSDRPVKLAERCTVFMESDLVSYHQKGVPREDLIGGLCYPLFTTTQPGGGKRKIGERVMFLAGLAQQGVVALLSMCWAGADRSEAQGSAGAFGAAVCLQEKSPRRKEKGALRGLASAIEDRMDYARRSAVQMPIATTSANSRSTTLTGAERLGRRVRPIRSHPDQGKKQETFSSPRGDVDRRHVGVFEELKEEPLMEVDGRPTVGIQRALYTLQTGVMWLTFSIGLAIGWF